MALAARLYGPEQGASRSEQAFATGILFLLGITLPIHVLGWSGHLTRGNLAWSALGLSVLCLTAALVGVAQPGRFMSHALLRVLLTPLVALRLCWRARSLTFVGLALTMGIIAWTALLSYLAPASGWDGLWYHDSIVGFSIQNHGFAIERSLPVGHHLINGYARGSEYFNLFPALLWDRRLLELAPSVSAAIALPGLAALFARFGVKPSVRIGLACAYVLIPAASLQLRSTYIDLQVAVAYLAGLYFVTRPELRLRDAVMSVLSLALLCHAKSSGLPMAGVMFGLFGLRVLLRYGRRAPLLAVLGLTAGLLVITALGGAAYIRNYVVYHNPVYPIVVESPRLNIHWQGPSVMVMPNTRNEFLTQLVSAPSCGQEWPDTRTNGYGNGPPLIVLPGALIALALLIFEWGLTVYRRRRPGPELANISWIVALTCAMAPMAPSWTWARFNLNLVLGVFALFAWWLGRERSGQLGEGSIAALQALSLLTLLWSQPAWGVPPAVARDLWKQTAAERATMQIAEFSLPKEVAVAREKELGAGDTVLIDWGIDFMSLGWNERFSNRVELISPDDVAQSSARIAKAKPKWVVIRPETPVGQTIVSNPAFQLVGPFRSEFLAYRRLAP